jgi:hypothetical protein
MTVSSQHIPQLEIPDMWEDIPRRAIRGVPIFMSFGAVFSSFVSIFVFFTIHAYTVKNRRLNDNSGGNPFG